MTNNFVLLLTTTVMVLLLSSNTLVINAEVVDIEGNPVLTGTSYITVNVDSPTSVAAVQIDNSCPLYIAPQPDLNLASQLIFKVAPVDSDVVMVISEGTPVTIELASNPDLGCSDSLALQVVDNTVRTGGALAIGEDFFQITNRDDQAAANPVYKLQYCQSQVQSCTDIGIISDPNTGRQLLALVSTLQISPFYFQFQKM